MKLAVFSDIHGNISFFEAFLKDAEKKAQKAPSLKISSDDKENDDDEFSFDETAIEEENTNQKQEKDL